MQSGKSCDNCRFRRGEGEYALCQLSQVHCWCERRYPTVCGENYEGWQTRYPTRWQRFWRWLW
jgi:hypothetical protein